jgi:hypothetical protein
MRSSEQALTSSASPQGRLKTTAFFFDTPANFRST